MRIIRQLLLFSAVLLGPAFLSGQPVLQQPATSASVLINEILPLVKTDSPDPYRTHQWLEIYNSGLTPQNLGGWTISNRSGSPIYTFPDIEIPPRGYLVIHFTTGSDDPQNLYAGEMAAFDGVMDEVALYSGQPGSQTIVDFLAWSGQISCDVTDVGRRCEPAFTPGGAHDLAVAAGIWQAGDFLPTQGVPGSSRREPVLFPGKSIGRAADSADTDKAVDWDLDGGRDAIDITPHLPNRSDLRFTGTIPFTWPVEPPKKWTFMVFMNGDNDLERYAFSDLNEMEQVGSDRNINIVVQVDLYSLNGGKAERLYITRDADDENVKSLRFALTYEPNMGDPKELTAFIRWAAGNYPADHYALILWDHGGGYAGFSSDWTANDDHITMPELEEALRSVSNVRFDIIGFDACLMSMVEVALQVMSFADVFVASEETEPGRGWPYDQILGPLEADPKKDARSLAKVIVEAYTAQERDRYSDGYSFSALDLSRLLRLVAAVNGLAEDLQAAIEKEPLARAWIRAAWRKTDAYRRDYAFADLGHFARQLLVEAKPLPWASEYSRHAQVLDEILDDGGELVFALGHGGWHSDSTGLSIYFPQGSLDSDYGEHIRWFYFPALSRWDEFLHAYLGG